MLVGPIARLLANVSAPIAALFALGYLAQVVNIWMVASENYKYGFITAWHIASVIDRTVVIGIGLKYLFISLVFVAVNLLVAWLVVWPLMQAFATPPDGPVSSSWVFSIGGPVNIVGQAPATSNDNKADFSSWWLGSILLAAFVAIGWLFFMGWIFPTPKGDKVVLSYLPYVNMTVTGSTEATSSSVASDGQRFTGTAKPSNNGGDSTYTVSGSIDPGSSNPQG